MKPASQPLLILCLYICSQALLAQEIIDLWQADTMPYHIENEVQEYQQVCWEEKICVYQVTKPTLTIYKVKATVNNTAKAVIILPGGGYETEAITHEGHEVAQAFADKGITAAVLKYRLPNPKTSYKPEMTPLSDVRKSISVLRKLREKLGISSNQIGVIGFSAGSHLATVASLWPVNNPAEKPDFSVLIYGVTRLNEENKKWLEDTLYFRPLTAEETKQNTLLTQVSAMTPPAFIAHAMDDTICHYSESTLYAEALSHQGVQAELHLFAKGGHGFGLGRASDGTEQWLDLATAWIKRL